MFLQLLEEHSSLTELFGCPFSFIASTDSTAMPRSGKVSLGAVFPSDRTSEPSGVFVHLVLSSSLCLLWRHKSMWVLRWWWWCPRALRTWDTLFLLWFQEKQKPNDFYSLENREGARYSEHFQYDIFFSFSVLNFILFFQARNGAQLLALPICSKMLSWDQACLWPELCSRLTVDWLCFSALPKLFCGVLLSTSMLVWAFIWEVGTGGFGAQMLAFLGF